MIASSSSWQSTVASAINESSRVDRGLALTPEDYRHRRQVQFTVESTQHPLLIEPRFALPLRYVSLAWADEPTGLERYAGDHL
jgi:hypothetical protein